VLERIGDMDVININLSNINKIRIIYCWHKYCNIYRGSNFQL